MNTTIASSVYPDATSRTVPVSLRTLCRIGGVLYLTIIAIGVFGEMGVRGRILVPGDALATAANLRALESLWRVGIAAELLLLCCATALAVILYVLIRPVSREGALLAIFFDMVAIAVEAAVAMYLVTALFPIGSAAYLSAFQPEQLGALTLMSMRGHAFGFGVSLVFFGVFCVVFGCLVYRSGYIPKALGILMLLAGVCYLVNSFALILSPALASRLFPFVLLPSFVGELSFALWLLFRGVTEARVAAAASAVHA